MPLRVITPLLRTVGGVVGRAAVVLVLKTVELTTEPLTAVLFSEIPTVVFVGGRPYDPELLSRVVPLLPVDSDPTLELVEFACTVEEAAGYLYGPGEFSRLGSFVAVDAAAVEAEEEAMEYPCPFFAAQVPRLRC